MITAVVRPLLGIFYDLLIPQEKKSLHEIFRSFLHAILFGCIVVMLSQQISLLNDLYAEKGEEFTRATKLYVEEQCEFYRGSSQARIKECSELNIILNSWPIVRALSAVVKTWNTCLYMPCNELMRNVAEHLQYKIAFIVIALAIASYLFNFFSCTKKKSKEWIDKYRFKKTMEDMAAFDQAMKQHHTVNFGSHVKTQ